MATEHIKPLNYCAHAIEDLRVKAAQLQSFAPNSARVLRKLIVMLQSSIKFILPDCCNLIDPEDMRQAHLDLLRLPFPCAAFETSWESHVPGPDFVGEFKQSPATKRIALCWDAREFEPLPGLNSFLDAFKDGGVFVLPIYWASEQKIWTVAFGGVFIPYGTKLADVDLSGPMPAASRIAKAALIDCGQADDKSKEFRGEPFPVLPEIYEMTVAAYGNRAKADAQIIVDSNDEVMVLIQACSVLNCANVTTADVDARPAINKKRLAKGKQPFFSYKVLELTKERMTPGQAALPGHHASPRTSGGSNRKSFGLGRQ
jgi:hypothetical protein